MRRWRWGKVCLVVDDEMVDAATRVSFLHEAATLLPDWLVRANDRLHLPGSRPPPCSRREKGRRRRSVVLYTVRPCTHTHTQSAEPIEIFGTTHFVAARHRVRASHRAAFSFFQFLCVTCVAITYTGIFPIVLDCTTDIIRVCVCVSPKDWNQSIAERIVSSADATKKEEQLVVVVSSGGSQSFIFVSRHPPRPGSGGISWGDDLRVTCKQQSERTVQTQQPIDCAHPAKIDHWRFRRHLTGVYDLSAPFW